MRPEDVQRMLDRIREEKGDPEAAHWEQDNLYFSLLRTIAEGTCSDIQECARLAITSAEIKFPRWYA